MMLPLPHNTTVTNKDKPAGTGDAVADPALEGASTWPVWTDDKFPFRVLLRDDQATESVRHRLADSLELSSRQHPEFSFGQLADVVLESLCGTEPLTPISLLTFLDGFAAAVESELRKRVNTRLNPDIDRSAKTRQVQAQVNETNKPAPTLEGRTPLDISLAQVDANPGRVLRTLNQLAELDSRDPDLARRMRLVEFAGSTEEELALYFGCDSSEMRAEIDITATELLQRIE